MTERDFKIWSSRDRDEWERLIFKWVHSELDRALLKAKFLDELTYEELTYEFPQLQIAAIKRRVKRAKTQLYNHINDTF